MNQELIGRFIQNLRKEKGLTQDELAIKLGVTDRAISHWENGRRLPDYTIIGSLCKELGVTVNDLFNGSVIKEKDSSKKSEETLLNVLEYENKEKKRYKRKIMFSIIITMLIIISSILSIYFINNYNKIHIYEFSGSNDNFMYSGVLVKTNDVIYYFSNGVYDNHDIDDKNYEVISASLKYKDNRFLGTSSNFVGSFSEKYGYQEIFRDETLNNLDKWYIEVYYYNDNNEIVSDTFELKYKESMSNTKLIPIKEKSISDDNEEIKITITEKDKKNYDKYSNYLLDMGFVEDTPKTRKISNVIYPETATRMFSKINEDRSSYTADVHLFRTWIYLNYYSDKYDVRNLFGKVYFDNHVEDNKFTYEYNPKTNMGSCKSGNCPENFIREAREFYKEFKKDFQLFFED